ERDVVVVVARVGDVEGVRAGVDQAGIRGNCRRGEGRLRVADVDGDDRGDAVAVGIAGAVEILPAGHVAAADDGAVGGCDLVVGDPVFEGHVLEVLNLIGGEVRGGYQH